MIAVSRPPALTREGNEALERRLRGLETKRPLDLEVVARAIRRIRRPEALAARLGDALRYSQRVEADVAGLGIETLLPRAGGDFDGRFLAVWVPDELGHADAQAVLLDHLGLPAYQSRPADAVPIQNRLAGTLGRLSAHAYEIVSLAYHTIGAINERLAIAAYTRMSAIAHEMGEVELADSVVRSHAARRIRPPRLLPDVRPPAQPSPRPLAASGRSIPGRAHLRPSRRRPSGRQGSVRPCSGRARTGPPQSGDRSRSPPDRR